MDNIEQTESSTVDEVKIKELQEKVENQRKRIVYLEGATSHACGTPLSNAIKECNKLRAELERANKDNAILAERLTECEYEKVDIGAKLERLKATNAQILEIVKKQTILEDNDNPGNCRAYHNRANDIKDAIEKLLKSLE